MFGNAVYLCIIAIMTVVLSGCEVQERAPDIPEKDFDYIEISTGGGFAGPSVFNATRVYADNTVFTLSDDVYHSTFIRKSYSRSLSYIQGTKNSNITILRQMTEPTNCSASDYGWFKITMRTEGVIEVFRATCPVMPELAPDQQQYAKTFTYVYNKLHRFLSPRR